MPCAQQSRFHIVIVRIRSIFVLDRDAVECVRRNWRARAEQTIRRDITADFIIKVPARGGSLTRAAGIRIAVEVGIANIASGAARMRHIFIRSAIKSDHICIDLVQTGPLQIAAAV